MKKQNFSLQGTFPIKLYQLEEDPTIVQISGKGVQWFLYLVVGIFNCETKQCCP